MIAAGHRTAIARHGHGAGRAGEIGKPGKGSAACGVAPAAGNGHRVMAFPRRRRGPALVLTWG